MFAPLKHKSSLPPNISIQTKLLKWINFRGKIKEEMIISKPNCQNSLFWGKMKYLLLWNIFLWVFQPKEFDTNLQIFSVN